MLKYKKNSFKENFGEFLILEGKLVWIKMLKRENIFFFDNNYFCSIWILNMGLNLFWFFSLIIECGFLEGFVVLFSMFIRELNVGFLRVFD